MHSTTDSVEWESVELLEEKSKYLYQAERPILHGNPSIRRRTIQTKKTPVFASVCLGLWLSIIVNCILITVHLLSTTKAQLCVSKYTGLGLSSQRTYQSRTDYLDENRTMSDELWDTIDTSPNTIALDDDYIQRHGLAPSIPFPWDQSKGLYLIKAFHHMHCLKNIRRAYLDALASQLGEEQLIQEDHVLHCIDGLRQDIICRPDDTPMPSIPQLHRWGDGQTHQCKDWDALIKWTQDPQRHACFKMLSDYRRVPHSLEQFAFCLENSPYIGVMEEYFREYGHKDPFSADDKRLDQHKAGSGY